MCIGADESKRTKRKLTQMGGAPTADTIMARAKDYTQKIQFWTEQLDTALLVGSSAYYSEAQCRESLAHFKRRQREVEANRDGFRERTTSDLKFTLSFVQELLTDAMEAIATQPDPVQRDAYTERIEDYKAGIAQIEQELLNRLPS